MQPFTCKQDGLSDAVSEILKQSKLQEEAEITEAVEEIKKIVSTLKVGDKTNFGKVVTINADNIEFKAKDTPKTKIAFKARKMGSKDFILDKLIKLKEDVQLQESVLSDLKKIDKLFSDLEDQFAPNSTFVRSIVKEYGKGYAKDAADVWAALQVAYNKFEAINQEVTV